MALHTIKYKDTLPDIFKIYEKTCNAKNANDIWNHKVNKILRLYWPKSENTTDKELPIGYSLYIPTSAPISLTIDKDGKKRTCVEKRALKHLRLKIRYYKTYDHYLWYNYDWKSRFLKDHFKTREELDNELYAMNSITFRDMIITPGMGAVLSPEATERLNNIPGVSSQTVGQPLDPNAKVYYYLDHKTNRYIPTTTPVKDFKEVIGDTMEPPDNKFGGAVRGDNSKTNLKSLDEGFVYLFRRNVGESNALCEFCAVYRVTPNGYKQVDVDDNADPCPKPDMFEAGDASVKKNIFIADFFHPNDQYNPDVYNDYYIYVSKFALTRAVITDTTDGLVKTVPEVGTRLPQASWLFTQKNNSKSAGDLHRTYQESGKVAGMVDYLSYPYELVMEYDEESEKKEYTLYLNVPDMEDVIRKKNNAYTSAYANFLNWRDQESMDESRNQKTFLYIIINFLLKNKKLTSHELDMDKIEDYQYNESYNYRIHFIRYENAALDLIANLKDPKFVQLVKNYSNRSKVEIKKNEAEYTDWTNEEPFEKKLKLLLRDGFRDLQFSYAGANLYKELVSDNGSIFNQLLRGLATIEDKDEFTKKGRPNELPKVLIHEEADKIDLNLLNVFRKSTDVLMEWITGFIPAVFVSLGEINNRQKLMDSVNKMMGYEVAKYTLPSEFNRRWKKVDSNTKCKKLIQEYFGVFEKKNWRWSETGNLTGPRNVGLGYSLGSISFFLETVNFTFAFTNFIKGDKSVEDCLQLAGGLFDMTVSFFGDLGHTRTVSGVLSKCKFIGKTTPVIAFASCLIDAYFSGKDMISALDDDEIVVAVGHGLQGIGYLVAATGAYGAMGGVIPALSSVLATGTFSVTAGVAIGVVIGFSLVGLALIIIGACIVCFNDTGVRKWAMSTWFGRYYDKKPDEIKINEILSWLSAFEVKHMWRVGLVDYFVSDYKSELTFRVIPRRLISSESTLVISRPYAIPGYIRLANVREEIRIKFSDFISHDYKSQSVYFMGRQLDNRKFKIYKNLKWGRIKIRGLIDNQNKIEELEVLFQFFANVKRVTANFRFEIVNSNMQKLLPEPLKKKYEWISSPKIKYDTDVGEIKEEDEKKRYNVPVRLNPVYGPPG